MSVDRKPDPRNNADDAYDAFVKMGDSEWQGLLRSLAGGGVLTEAETEGFKRARTERAQLSRTETVDAAPVIPNYAGEELPTPQDAIRALGQLAAKQGLLELEIEDLEQQLKDKKKELAEYAEKLVPTALEQMGIGAGSKIKTLGGLTVELKEDVRASIPQDPTKRQAALDWLYETGNDGIVKREITISYPREKAKFADELMDKLRDMGVMENASVENDWDIHNSTLVAFIKAELREGREVPMSNFGAFIQKRAKINRSGK